MSQWNPLELQLRSWTPRAPSASLKARIFRPGQAPASPPAPARDAGHRASAWHWLTPATAVFLLGLFLYGNQAGMLHQFHQAPTPSLLATAVLREPELSAYYADIRHSENNALRNTFEWTNANENSSTSRSSVSTAPPIARTNSVIY